MDVETGVKLAVLEQKVDALVKEVASMKQGMGDLHQMAADWRAHKRVGKWLLGFLVTATGVVSGIVGYWVGKP